jgi:hypothetical protein
MSHGKLMFPELEDGVAHREPLLEELGEQTSK